MSLGTMMLLILVFGLWLGRQADQARRQRDVIAAVKAHGGWVHYDYEFVNGKLTGGQEPCAPIWMRKAVGDEYFREIRQVSFVYDDSTGKRYNNTNSRACDDVLALLAHQPGLTRILMQGTQATDGGLWHLRNLTGLEDLYIWDSTLISDAGVANLKNLVNLRNLHLDKSKVTDDGFRQLAGLKKLEHLVLEDSPFSDRGLAAVRDMKRLTWLCIGGSPTIDSAITDDGLSVIAGLQNLQILDLGFSKVSDQGLSHIIGLKKLTTLDLQGCEGITNEGLTYISQLENLQSLLLKDTMVTSPGLEHLMRLKQLKLLTLPMQIPGEVRGRFKSSMPASLRISH
jgi:hypothetical protein